MCVFCVWSSLNGNVTDLDIYPSHEGSVYNSYCFFCCCFKEHMNNAE